MVGWLGGEDVCQVANRDCCKPQLCEVDQTEIDCHVQGQCIVALTPKRRFPCKPPALLIIQELVHLESNGKDGRHR